MARKTKYNWGKIKNEFLEGDFKTLASFKAHCKKMREEGKEYPGASAIDHRASEENWAGLKHPDMDKKIVETVWAVNKREIAKSSKVAQTLFSQTVKLQLEALTITVEKLRQGEIQGNLGQMVELMNQLNRTLGMPTKEEQSRPENNVNIGGLKRDLLEGGSPKEIEVTDFSVIDEEVEDAEDGQSSED